VSERRDIRLLLADVDGTLVTQDKILAEAANAVAGSCSTPALRLPSPAADDLAA
jgi:phosphoglycolate phosphatase-like HAD superfamily hydrolase